MVTLDSKLFLVLILKNYCTISVQHWKMGLTIQLLYILVLMICYSKINWQVSKIYQIQSVLGRNVRRQELRFLFPMQLSADESLQLQFPKQLSTDEPSNLQSPKYLSTEESPQLQYPVQLWTEESLQLQLKVLKRKQLICVTKIRLVVQIH